MKFLLDIPVGREVAEWLREQSYDVLEVRQIDPSLIDEEILKIALSQQRVVITMDKDFGELAVRQGAAHCGIVRLPDVRVPERKSLLSLLLTRHMDALQRGALITVSRTRIRIRG